MLLDGHLLFDDGVGVGGGGGVGDGLGARLGGPGSGGPGLGGFGLGGLGEPELDYELVEGGVGGGEGVRLGGPGPGGPGLGDLGLGGLDESELGGEGGFLHVVVVALGVRHILICCPLLAFLVESESVCLGQRSVDRKEKWMKTQPALFSPQCDDMN